MGSVQAAFKRQRKPAACGTDSGYYGHTRVRKEPPCTDCKKAHGYAEQVRYARRNGKPIPDPEPVATVVVMRPLQWMESASCRFSGDLGPTAACKSCPVREVCLWYGMSNELPSMRFHVYGGLSPDQRSALGVTQEQARDRYVLARESVR